MSVTKSAERLSAITMAIEQAEEAIVSEIEWADCDQAPAIIDGVERDGWVIYAGYQPTDDDHYKEVVLVVNALTDVHVNYRPTSVFKQESVVPDDMKWAFCWNLFDAVAGSYRFAVKVKLVEEGQKDATPQTEAGQQL